jgi:uncharacterized Ntn-hydrolase superfamily protein
VTYSLTAVDPVTGRFGVAVQSCVFAVGTRVPALADPHGAVAVQAGFASWYRRPATELLRRGMSAPDVVAAIAALPGADSGQVAVVSQDGRAAAHTGDSCIDDAGHVVKDGAAAAGNLLTRSAVWHDMLDAYDGVQGSFEQRLVAALQAGEAAGGDVRGRQSAAILISAAADRTTLEVDLRVDDSPAPVDEIERLVNVRAAHDELRRVLSDESTDAWTPAAAERLVAAAATVPGDPLLTVWTAIAAASTGLDEHAAVHLARARTQNASLEDYLMREPALSVDDRRDRVLRLLGGPT